MKELDLCPRVAASSDGAHNNIFGPFHCKAMKRTKYVPLGSIKSFIYLELESLWHFDGA